MAAAALGAADVSPTAYPFWDAKESIEQYAKRTNLPTTKTLDLGNGVSLEFVLIPAGKFIMGTLEPESPWIGGSILGLAGLLVLILAAQVLIRAVREHRRPQFSLLWLIVVVLILGVAEYGGFRCWRAVQASRKYPCRDESPAHEVTLSRPFYMPKFLTTQEQYQQVMGTNPSHFKGASLPVEMVSWDDAQEFCKKVSAKTGQGVRLPTEAEWEFACRAGTTTTYYSGDTEADLDRAAWYEANSGKTTHPVGQKESNAYGLYDMHGNVWEWCQDGFAEYEPGPATDPQGRPDTGFERIERGGTWFHNARRCRAAYRSYGEPCIRDASRGFRVVVAAARTP